MQKLSIFLTFSLIIIIACSCGNSSPQCAHGNPTAIFNPKMQFIKNHHFQQKESTSSEQLEIPEFDLSLEILQSGCERIKQMFKITLNGSQNDLTTAPQIAELTADILAAISQLDKENLGSFFQVAQWTGQNAAQFQLDSPVLISNPDNSQIQLSLNLVRQPKQTIISLTIEF